MTRALLEKLSAAIENSPIWTEEMRLAVIDLRAYLALPQGEPVAVVTCEGVMGVSFSEQSNYGCALPVGTPPYLHPAHTEAEPCAWTLDDEESDTYASACGELWSFLEGGPVENRVRFCHGCGKPVKLGVPAP